MDVISKNDRVAKAYKYAIVNLKSQKFSEALAHFCVVGTLLPQISVHNELKKEVLLAFDEYVDQRMKNSDLKDVLTCYDQVLRVFPNFEEIPHKIGCLFFDIEEHDMALYYLQKSLEINALFTPAIMCKENISNYLIERWHFRMLNDTQRNCKYQLALKKALGDKPKSVLDIGTGTGLLSMFAVQSGAKKVFACDSSLTMCDISEKVIKSNGMEKKISIINKMSMEMEIGIDLPKRVSLLVSEIFDAGLFGEGVLTTLKHAWDELLSTNKGNKYRVIPRSATIYFCLIQSHWVASKNRVLKSHFETFKLKDNLVIASEDDYDDPYSSEFLSLIPGGFIQLSEPQQLLTVNFNDPKEIAQLLDGKTFSETVKCTRPGSCDAIALWFDLKLDQDISILTSPQTNSCWEQAVFPIRQNLILNNNSSLKVKFFCQDILRLVKVQRSEDQHEPVRNLFLKSAWIRKLNDETFCKLLEKSVKESLEKGHRKFIDASSIPLGGILAAKLGAEEVVFTEDIAAKCILDFSEEFGVSFNCISFQTVTKLTEQTKRFHTIIFDPVDQNGMLKSGVFEDLALIRTLSLTNEFSVIPHHMCIVTTLIQSPLICNYTKVTSDQNVSDLNIAQFINKYKTQFFEDFRMESLPYSALSNTLEMARIDFKGSVSQLSESVSDLVIEVREHGKIDAVPFWFLLTFSEGDDVLNTLTATSYSHAALIPDESIPVTVGQKIAMQPSYKHSIVFAKIS